MSRREVGEEDEEAVPLPLTNCLRAPVQVRETNHYLFRKYWSVSLFIERWDAALKRVKHLALCSIISASDGTQPERTESQHRQQQNQPQTKVSAGKSKQPFHPQACQYFFFVRTLFLWL